VLGLELGVGLRLGLELGSGYGSIACATQSADCIDHLIMLNTYTITDTVFSLTLCSKQFTNFLYHMVAGGNEARAPECGGSTYSHFDKSSVTRGNKFGLVCQSLGAHWRPTVSVRVSTV